MTTSLRDVTSAQMVHALAEMNCFEQDCVIYGYAWQRENGKRMYSLSEDELLIQQSFERHLKEHCCMTPVRQYKTRAVIKEETQEDLFLYLKLQLAKELRDAFNDVYFRCLAELQRTPGDAQAEEILLPWQAELDGYFEEDKILLFSGAVDYAYVTKHLPEWRYRQLQKWISQTKKQMIRRMYVHDQFERTFYGVVCVRSAGSSGDAAPQYSLLCNANEKTLNNKVKELDQQGISHTPVYKKTYWYARSTDLPRVRQTFEADLKEIMDETYLARVMRLQKLPSAIPGDLWRQCLREVEAGCSAEALDGLRYWGSRWNITAT